MDGIDFELRRGEAFGFLGPNGAGKSSTMRMIGCVSPPSGGELSILGLDPVTDGPAIRARLGVVPQEDTLDVELTVRENLLIYGRYFGLPRAVIRERTARLLDFVQLTDRADDQVEPLSGGHEAAADHRPVADQRAGDPAARRAHHRAGPAGQARGLGPAVPAQAAGRDADPDHALHGRGRAAVRPAGGDGRRQDRGGGLAARADRAPTPPPRCWSCGSTRPSHEQAAEKLAAVPAERMEVLADRILLYIPNGDAALAAVRDLGLEPVTSLVRRSTLEDVFLRLTGRRLED